MPQGQFISPKAAYWLHILIFIILPALFVVDPATATETRKAMPPARHAAIQTPRPAPPRPAPPRPATPAEGAVRTLSRAQAANNPLDVLKLIPFILDDVTAAKTDADAQKPPDIIASSCWGAIITFINSNPVINPLPSGLGAAQLVQKARDLAALAAQIKSPTGPLAPLKMGCGALIVDTQNDLILGLGALLGLIK